MRDTLNDELDALEEQEATVEELVDARARRVLIEAIRGGLDAEEAMAIAALAATEEVTDLSTKAFRLGLDFASKRLKQ